MSNGDYEFLKTLTDGERWVWLGSALAGMNDRMAATEDIQEVNCRELDKISDCCASRGWTVSALKFLIVTFTIQVLAITGWALAKVLAG